MKFNGINTWSNKTPRYHRYHAKLNAAAGGPRGLLTEWIVSLCSEQAVGISQTDTNGILIVT